MEEGRRSSWNYQQQQGNSRWNKQWRPPHPQGRSHLTVPSWEKRFCTSVCMMPWKKLCESKNLMHMYKNIVEWDDSAGLEAFHDAKSRFWADINGLPCDAPSPDPDIYIDNVDYNPFIDPELVEDLDIRQPELPEEDDDATNGYDSFLLNQPIQPTGWGDAEDPVPSNNNNWDHFVEKPTDHTNAWNSGSWHYNGVPHNDNGWNQSSGWGGNSRDSSWGTRGDWSGEQGRRNGRNRDGGGNYGLRSTKPRHDVDNYQTNNRWSDNRGSNRTSYPYEKTTNNKHPMTTW